MRIFNQLFDENQNETIRKMYADIKQFLLQKKEGDIDTRDILTIKGLIRRGEARTACTYNRIPLDHVHFLDLPFYETGRIEKNPISETDVQIVQKLLQEVQPHQIYVAGDLAGKECRCRMVEGLPHLDVPRGMGGMGNREHRDGCAVQSRRASCETEFHPEAPVSDGECTVLGQ